MAVRGQTRRAAAAVVTGLAGLLLAGCSLPAGIDGDLVDGWSAMPEPTGFVPDAGVCHDTDYEPTGTLADYRPVGCDGAHVAETVHVGEFGGDAAERVNRPDPGTGVWRTAYQECDEQAAQYLGADFRHAWLWLGVTVPSQAAWEGGARWFRCDVLPLETANFDMNRVGSLAGALADNPDLLLGCFDVELDDDNIERMNPVDCDETHHAEFVGVWRAPDGSFPDSGSSSSAEQVHRGCREQVAEYVDVPVDDDLVFRTGTIADWMDEEDWDNGDRGFRCYLWLNGDEIEGSLEDAGTDGLPIREA